jgi:hypothetical protein
MKREREGTLSPEDAEAAQRAIAELASGLAADQRSPGLSSKDAV